MSSQQNGEESKAVRPFGMTRMMKAYSRTFAVVFVVTAVVASAIVSFIPDTYTSKAVLLDPTATYREPRLVAFMGAGQISTVGQNAVAILKSRNMAERLIHKFDLANVYGDKDAEELLMHYFNHVQIINKKGSIEIEVKDVDPNRAADIANTMADELEAFIKVRDQHTGVASQSPAIQMKDPFVVSLVQLANHVAKVDADRVRIIVLDRAVPANKPSGPKRLLLVLMAVVFTLFLTMFVALMREARDIGRSSPAQ